MEIAPFRIRKLAYIQYSHYAAECQAIHFRTLTVTLTYAYPKHTWVT